METDAEAVIYTSSNSLLEVDAHPSLGYNLAIGTTRTTVGTTALLFQAFGSMIRMIGRDGERTYLRRSDISEISNNLLPVHT